MKNMFIQYGTAGFRSRADTLDTILFRVGMLAVLRSKKKNGQTVGLMITASHNPECDNGVKLIDPLGEMLEQSWEGLATALANAPDDEAEKIVSEIVKNENIDLNLPSSVFIGRDTRYTLSFKSTLPAKSLRPLYMSGSIRFGLKLLASSIRSSSPRLSEMALNGINYLKGTYKNYDVVTTPVLHYLVYCKNTFMADDPSEKDYDLKFINAFKSLNDYSDDGNYTSTVFLDGANGVGALKIKNIKDAFENLLSISLFNDGNGILNHECGADFVKVHKKPPKGVPIKANTRCVSFDGDADRIIYYYIDGTNTFHMLDGDRIAVLIAGYLIELIRKAKLDINLGLVQTAYANGNSTAYIEKVLNIPVACVPTGVKHLHHKALEFDIGIYFEANGHGSVIYSKSAEEKIRRKAQSDAGIDEEKKTAQRLCSMINLTNQTVGDAFSDMLIVETILKARKWNLIDWESTYTDLPNRLLKVTIKDRTIIKTNYTETVCLNPPELQKEIDDLVAEIPKGRSFIRASGTENVVRVYAEASTQEEADKLGLDVAMSVYKLAGGVGNLPSI